MREDGYFDVEDGCFQCVNRMLKVGLVGAVLATMIAIGMPNADSATAVKAGASYRPEGLTRSYGGKKSTGILVHRHLVSNKGVKVKPTPTGA